MYIVFVNNKPIYLSDQKNTDNTLEVCLYRDFRIEELLHKLRNTQAKGIFLYNPDLALLWKKFISYFTVVEAAGGLVIKNRKDALMIYRNLIWDLPKGKMEEGENPKETALREVEEECGVDQLNIISSLDKTFHIYHEKGLDNLKIIHWYLMESSSNKKPIPQTEEGITKAEFVPLIQLPKMYNTMYVNISKLIKNYLNINK